MFIKLLRHTLQLIRWWNIQVKKVNQNNTWRRIIIKQYKGVSIISTFVSILFTFYSTMRRLSNTSVFELSVAQ